MLRLLIFLILFPLSVNAASEQMLLQIERMLPRYRVEVDVRALTNAQVTAIWFELTSDDDSGSMDRLRKRQRILNIIRKGKDF